MKKILAILMALCLLCTAVSALADEAADETYELPEAIEAEAVDDFFGTWVLSGAIYNGVLLDEEGMAGIFGDQTPFFEVNEDKMIAYSTDENGEIQAQEIDYTFADGFLSAEDEDGTYNIVMLEDYSLAISMNDGALILIMVTDESEG